MYFYKYYNLFAYVDMHTYETFGYIRGKEASMQEFYYGMMIVISAIKLGYDIITDINDRHKSK